MLHTNVKINEKGHLEFAGLDTTELATKYGTPLMLLDSERVKSNVKTYVDGLKNYFTPTSFPCYASKALSIKEIYRLVNSQGAGIDVVSSGEIFTAKSAGFPLEKALFHGNNKTDADIEYAINNGVGFFVVDNLDELKAIDEIALIFLAILSTAVT